MIGRNTSNNDNNATVNTERQRLYNLTMANIQTVGNKQFVFAPKEIVFVDARFQRVEDSSKRKINKLARNWNENKLDPLKGSLHPEEFLISIIDGYHRVEAGGIVGVPGYVIEIARNLPTDPAKRLIAEAELFATQNDEVDNLSPVQRHKANVLCGIRENVILQKLLDKYGIAVKKNKAGGKVLAGHLAGFTQALRIIQASDETMLDNILCVLCSSRWNLETKGLSTFVLTAVYNVLRLHPDNTDAIMAEAIKFFKPIKPQKLYACAMERYPERNVKEQVTLYLEDILCDAIGMDRVYLVDKAIERVVKTA